MLHARMLARVHRYYHPIATFDLQGRIVDAAHDPDRTVDEARLADRLPDDDSVADRVRNVTVDRFEPNVRAGEPAHVAPLLARQLIDRDPLTVGERLDPALHAPALDRAPAIDERGAGLVLRTELVHEPRSRYASIAARISPAPNRLGRLALPALALAARLLLLAPGLGKTKTGRVWTYVCDGRPAAGQLAPAVWFAYSPDRKSDHPQRHLENFSGILQADGYAGYSKIYEGGRALGAACWAHVRRKFVELEELHQSPVAAQILDQIGTLYAIEQEIRSRAPDQRRAVRLERSRPLLDAMKTSLERTLGTLSQKSAMAKAIRYALARWEALGRYCDDGRIEIDNNAAERALRCVALGRKNYLFAGSDAGAESAAAIYSLLGTAKLNGYNPEAFLREVLARIADHPINRMNELLPWSLQATQPDPLTGNGATPKLPP